MTVQALGLSTRWQLLKRATARVEALVGRVDRPWVWPAIGAAGGVELSLLGVAEAWWQYGLIGGGGLLLVAGAAWAQDRRGQRLSRLEKQLETAQLEVDGLRGEVVVTVEALDGVRGLLDNVVARIILRHYDDHLFSSDERITWLLARDDLLVVVGRHCHDPARKRVETVTYPIDFGLMGRALASRRLVSQTFDRAGSIQYAQWQERSCRLDSGTLSTIGMKSVEYRVVPVMDHARATVLGVVVLESVRSGRHLDELADHLTDGPLRQTVIDVLELLAQAPEVRP